MNKKVTNEELLEELMCIIKDEFIGEIQKGEDCLMLKLRNGQEFKIELTEMISATC